MQLSSVLVLVADNNYLAHAKSVMVNAKRQGQWRGDYCLVLPPDCDKVDFEARGIHVLTDAEPTYYRKFALFDDYFQKWDIVFYMDCDVMIQNPLEPLLHEVGWGEILADRELFTLGHSFTYWATPEELLRPERREVFEWLWQQYDCNRQNFNTGLLLYHPRTLPPNSRQRLRTMRQKVAPINCHVVNGTEQPVINLVFYNRFARIRSDLVCYWNSAWDQTIVIHTCSGYAPWIDKTLGMDAYLCDKLNRPMHDIYREHLAAFDKEFPRQ